MTVNIVQNIGKVKVHLPSVFMNFVDCMDLVTWQPSKKLLVTYW